MAPVDDASAHEVGSVWKEFVGVSGRDRGGHGSMRGLLMRDLKRSRTKFLLIFSLWVPFILFALLVQSHPFQGGCEVPGAGSLPGDGLEAEDAQARSGLEGRSRQTHRRIMDPGFLDSVSRHFRLIFGEQVTAAGVYLTRDFLLIRTGGLMGTAEKGLLEAGADGDSDFIRTMKIKLAESNLESLVSDLSRATGLHFEDSYLSYSPADDEMMVLLTLPGGGRG
jgi:hypothetical protein